MAESIIPERCGKTLRYIGYNQKFKPYIVIISTGKQLSQNTYIFPVTALHVYESNITYNMYNTGDIGRISHIYMNKNGFDDMYEILQKSILTKSMLDNTDHAIYEFYDVEIIGNIIISPDKVSNKKLQDFYLKIDGIAYNPNYLYYRPCETLVDFRKINSFKLNNNLNRLKGAAYLNPGKKEVPFLISIKNEKIYSYGSNAYALEKSYNFECLDAYRSAEVDLGRDRSISHIGTMGKLILFKPFPDNNEKKSNIENAHRYIKYTTDISQAWVTHYAAYYRVNSGKKWILLGHFSGNFDRTTEVVHEIYIPIIARYIRFVPQKYVGKPLFQVSIFGESEPGEMVNTNSDTDKYVNVQVFKPIETKYLYTSKHIWHDENNLSQLTKKEKKRMHENMGKLKKNQIYTDDFYIKN